MTLPTRILVGLAAGVLAGTLSKVSDGTRLADALVALEPAGTVFIRLITMVVVPLIVASLIVGIGSLGESRQVGRTGGRAVGYFVATTFAGALIGTAVALATRIGAGVSPETQARLFELSVRGAQAVASAPAAPGLVQTLIDMIPTNAVAAAAQGQLLPLVIAVALFAAALTTLAPERRRPVLAVFEGVNDATMVLIRWMMGIAPLGVFVLVSATIAKFGLDLLEALLAFCVVVVIALSVHVVVVLLPLLRLGARMSAGRFLRGVSDALLMAFSTTSSNATLPVSMAAATGRLQVPAAIAGFVLPSGVTINKNGSAVYKAVTAVFLANLYGVSLGPGTVITIVFMSTVAAFTGAGVPGSSLITTLIVLNAIGLGPQASAGIAMVAGVDRLLDMFRTVTNTMGNLIGATVLARREGGQAVRRSGGQADRRTGGQAVRRSGGQA